MRNLMHANFIRYISRLSTLIAFAISLTLGFVTAYDSVKETYVKEIIDEEEQTIIEGEILDGTTLVYDDMICTKSGSKYTCNKK